jgi:cytochrome b pre-mRNA-processing protein 3
MISSLFKRKPKPYETLYEAIVAAARRPHFYADWHVPDTVDGRFDMIALHLFAVLERLKNEVDDKASAQDFAQKLVDTFFQDMDRSLREMGVGDLSVGKKVRKIAESFYGRVDAYRTALGAQDEAGLEAAISRNVFAGVEKSEPAALAQWLNRARANLAQQPLINLLAGRADFA